MDEQGLPLAMSDPILGNHHDLYDTEVTFEEVVSTMEAAEISADDLVTGYFSL